ncbi:MAG: peptidoglycan DD-metalloendopeptidase family protein [Janthinobacterium lividum]
MSKLLTPGHCRIAIQICAMTAVAALMSGCSADSNRFGDAFGNPFTTGSIQKPKKVAHTGQPIGTGRTPPVTASALPPRGSQVASAAPVRPAPIAVSHETTGSIGPARTAPGASFGGWTGQGGVSVQVVSGDTAGKLAERYGVPLPALLQVNGLHSASEVQPGGTIVVPIYNAVATAPGSARVSQAAPVRSEPVEPAHIARAEAPREEEAAEPVRRAGATPFKVERPATLAERNAEAQRIVATQRAADRAAADRAAADKAVADRKSAEADKVAAVEKAKLDKAAATRKLATKTSAPHPEAQKAAAVAEKAAAAQKIVADRDAAKAKSDAVKAAAASAKAAKVAAAPAAKPVAAKPEQVASLDRKGVDSTPTASVPPAAAPATAEVAAPATADAAGPEFRWPARGRIIQGFKGGVGGNDGINIAVPEGTQVKAAEGGVVAYAGSELKGYGNLVLIRHPNGYVTAYANNGEIDVKRGETVKRGQMIAKSGQSGNVNSPQLHFELRKGSTPVDPTTFLAGT